MNHFLLCSHSLWCHQGGACPWEWEQIVQWAGGVCTSCCHHSKNSRVSSDPQMSRGTSQCSQKILDLHLNFFIISAWFRFCSYLSQLLWDLLCCLEAKQPLNVPCFWVFHVASSEASPVHCSPWPLHSGTFTSLCVHEWSYLVIPISSGEGLYQSMLLRY